MIRVTVTRSKDGEVREFVVEGHAGEADHPEEDDDRICAAVSMLAINTVNSIEQFTDDSILVEAKEDGGYLKASFPDEISPETSLLIRSMLLGFSSVEESYGKQSITIRDKEELS